MTVDIALVRGQFPSLSRTLNGLPCIYFDNPAGTQVPRCVIEAVGGCYEASNANLGGYFATSVEAEALVDGARAAMADFLNAASPDEITFGQNMTTLTFHISRSIGRLMSPGDEIVVTRMDHDANIAPWLMLAEDRGLVVKWLDIDTERFELDLDALAALLTPKTKLLAIGYASNTIGTVNDIETAIRIAKSVGALVFVDAVQYAPHRLIDVQSLGADFLVCSAYKFFGPHQGVLWGRSDILAKLTPYKVRAVADDASYRFETGTQSHEGLAGTMAAVDYFAWYGREVAGSNGTRRQQIAAAFGAMRKHEDALARRLIAGLRRIPSVTVHGITSEQLADRRLPTVAFTSSMMSPSAIAKTLAGAGIFVWDGHNYAVELVNRLGLIETGGVVRIGLAHYNTADEVDRLIAALEELLRSSVHSC